MTLIHYEGKDHCRCAKAEDAKILFTMNSTFAAHN